MKAYLQQLVEGRTLSRQDTHDILLGVTQQRYNDSQLAALLMAMQTRGVTVEELLGFRDGLLETGRHIDLSDYNTLDIVGTGGDGKNTFNISTCAAFVIAACGYYVTKHGNGSATSVSGASNVLQAHGVRFTDDESQLRRSLEATHICYLHAPLFAYGMKYAAPTRKALGIPTCFNLLGPLVNPCQPRNSLHGTASHDQQRLYVNVHQRMGDNFGVVNSYDGYDEISLTSGFKLITNYFEKVFTPKDLGLDYVNPQDIYGGATAEEAWRIFDNVLEGTSTEAQRNVVIANAACGIAVMDRNQSIEDSVLMAREALLSGRALDTFRRFVELNS